MARPSTWKDTPEGHKEEHKFLKTIPTTYGGDLSSLHKSYDRQEKKKSTKFNASRFTGKKKVTAKDKLHFHGFDGGAN